MIKLKTIEEQLILHEGLKLKPYLCPAGYWTIGVGRNLEAKGLTNEEQLYVLGKGNLDKWKVIEELKREPITVEVALFLLENDIREVKRHLETYLWYRKLDPVRQKVLIDMAFNLGTSGLLRFRRMLLALSADDYQGAADEMIDSKWYRQVGDRGKRLVAMMRTGEDYKN